MTDLERDNLRVELHMQLDALVQRAHGAGLIVTVQSKLTPQGEAGGRYYETDVRCGRGFYPKEK